jgi:hypothetical protein
MVSEKLTVGARRRTGYDRIVRHFMEGRLVDLIIDLSLGVNNDKCEMKNSKCEVGIRK